MYLAYRLIVGLAWLIGVCAVLAVGSVVALLITAGMGLYLVFCVVTGAIRAIVPTKER